jgi:hypothetical protein
MLLSIYPAGMSFMDSEANSVVKFNNLFIRNNNNNISEVICYQGALLGSKTYLYIHFLRNSAPRTEKKSFTLQFVL